MATKKEITKHEETAIVPTAATRELTPGIWAMIERMAPVMYKAHLFGVTTPEQAAAIMLKGYECGFSITASFEFVQVIDGKPTVKPMGQMALLHSNPLVKEIKITRLEDKGKFIGYECFMERINGFSSTAQFTLEDATRAGLMKPQSGWMKYPENMCKWRAIGFAADIVFPDVTAGMTTLMKMPEAFGMALTEGGDVIEATATSVNVDPLQELVTQYGAEAVMQANNGAIPMMLTEVEEVRRKLEASKENVNG
jgi:hypothetical protein